jgi:hypothetical protein
MFTDMIKQHKTIGLAQRRKNAIRGSTHAVDPGES